jgi:hypothetical protein
MASTDPVAGVDAIDLSPSDRAAVLEQNAHCFLRAMPGVSGSTR